MKIGYRIRDLRKQRRVTLKALADKTGLTTSFLSQLERERTSPSINSLEKIAKALNTKVGYFFEKEGQRGFIFIKKGRGRKFIEKGIVSDSLACELLNIKMRPHIFTLAKGAQLRKELIDPEGEKFGMVLKGRLEFLCEKERVILEEGDSICCVSSCPEKLINIGETEAKLLWIVFPTG